MFRESTVRTIAIAGAEEREAGLEQDVVRHDEREEDKQRRREVGDDLPEHDPEGACSLRDRRLDELLFAEREDLAAHGPRHVRDQDDPDDQRRDPETLPVDRREPERKPSELQRRAQRDREQEDRERPDHVEDPRQDPVDPAPVVAGEQCEHRREEDREDRRPDPDLERVDAAVEEADGDVPAVQVRAEDKLATRREPLRPDGIAGGNEDRLTVRAFRDSALRKNVHLLPVLRKGVGDVVRVRTRVGDVVRVDRRKPTADEDQEEEEEEGKRDIVPPEAPPGKRPRAAAHDLGAALLGREHRRGVERELRRVRGGHRAPFPATLSVASLGGAPRAERPSVSKTYFFRQIDVQSNWNRTWL